MFEIRLHTAAIIMPPQVICVYFAHTAAVEAISRNTLYNQDMPSRRQEFRTCNLVRRLNKGLETTYAVAVNFVIFLSKGKVFPGTGLSRPLGIR